MTTDVQSGNWVNPNPPATAQKPPGSEAGVLGWLHTNLFSSVLNGILTVLTLAFAVFVVNGFVRWVLAAYWEPVWANRKLFAVGPIRPTNWQPAVVLLVTCLLLAGAGRWGTVSCAVWQSGLPRCWYCWRSFHWCAGANGDGVSAGGSSRRLFAGPHSTIPKSGWCGHGS